ncbi:MAG: transcription termination factor NusA [Bifidobacteriaceae bacterium]|jgi:N utilization substance protein A|nr:transcription termination factor NusA [Bifidobacteriaceae bacterium]
MDINMAELRALEREREIRIDLLIVAIEQALGLAYEKTEGAAEAWRVDVDRTTGHVTVWAQERAEDGTLVREWDDTPSGFGRIAAATARQVIVGRLRDVDDSHVIGTFEARENEIVTGTVVHAGDTKSIKVDLGGVEGVIPPQEQIPGEKLNHGDRVRALVHDVTRGPKGPAITLSRSHPMLVLRLFALEVPEVADGRVEIASIAREAGHRSKIAVRTSEPGLNAKGACIGQMGGRVRAVLAELAGEKIDIVDYSDDPAKFVAAALSPSQVKSVEIVDENARSARVIVPDYQLSLAIGREGQNARLAAKLTGWRIDIRSDAEEPGAATPSGGTKLTGPRPADVARAPGGGLRNGSGAASASETGAAPATENAGSVDSPGRSAEPIR